MPSNDPWAQFGAPIDQSPDAPEPATSEPTALNISMQGMDPWSKLKMGIVREMYQNRAKSQAAQYWMTELMEMMSDGQRWIRTQELNAAQPSIIPPNDASDATHLTHAILRGSDAYESIGSTLRTTDAMDKVDAFREGMPVRTGFDIDWEAVKDEPMMAFHALGAGIASALGFQSRERAWMVRKFLHTDNQSALMRIISHDNPMYDEQSLGGDVLHMARGNDGMRWDPGSDDFQRALLGKDVYETMQRQSFINSMTVMDPYGVVDDSDVDAMNDKWYAPNVANASSLFEIMYNDPFTLVDLGLDVGDFVRLSRKAPRAAMGETLEAGTEWVSRVDHLASYDEMASYRSYRNDQISGGFDADEIDDFVTWRRSKFMESLTDGTPITAGRSLELSKLDSDYAKGVMNGASTEDLKVIADKYKQVESKLLKAKQLNAAPYHRFYESMEGLVRALREDEHLLGQISAHKGDESVMPQYVRQHLNKFSDEYRQAVQAGDIGTQQRLTDAYKRRAQQLMEGAAMSDDAAIQRRMLAAQEQTRVFSENIEKYEEISGFLTKTYGPKQSSKYMRALFAELNANVARGSATVRDGLPLGDSVLAAHPTDIINIHVADLDPHTLQALLENADNRELYQMEVKGRQIDPLFGEMPNLNWLRGRADPYFANGPLKEVGLDWGQAERHMVDWAEETAANHDGAFELLRPQLGAPANQDVRNAVGQILALDREFNPEMFVDAINYNGRNLDASEIADIHQRANRQVDEAIDVGRTKARDLATTYDELILKLQSYPPDFTDLSRKRFDEARIKLRDLQGQADPDGLLQPTIERLDREARDLLDEAIMRGAEYHSPEGQKLIKQIQRHRRTMTENHDELTRLEGQRKTLKESLDGEIEGYSLDRGALLRGVLGRDATPAELQSVMDIQSLVEDMWEQLLLHDKDLVGRVRGPRDLKELVRVLHGSQTGPGRGHIKRGNAFDPNTPMHDVANYDVTEAINYVVHTINRRKHMKPVLDRLDGMSAASRLVGDHSGANYYDVIAKRMRGEPAEWDQQLDALWTDTVNKFVPNPAMRDFLMTHQVGRPTKVAMGFVRGSYIGNLLGNVGFAVKNMTGMSNTAAYFGQYPTLKGLMRLAQDPEDLLRKSGLTVNVTDFYGGGDAATKFVDGALKVNALPENVLRGTAAYAAMDLAAADWARAGLIKAPTAEAIREAGLYEQWLRQGLDGAFETQHVYGLMGLPVASVGGDVWGNKTLRPGIQFINYWAKQSSFLLRMASDNRIGKFIKMMAVTGETIRVMEQMGVDASSFAGASYGGPSVTSPATQLWVDLIEGHSKLSGPDAVEGRRQLANVAQTAATIGLGSQGVPAGAIFRGLREGYAGAVDNPIVADSEGNANYYVSSDERLLRFLNLPSIESRDRRRLYKLGQYSEAKKAAALDQQKWEFQEFARQHWNRDTGQLDVDGVTMAAMRERLVEIGTDSGAPISNKQIDAVMNKQIYPKTWKLNQHRDRRFGMQPFVMANRQFVYNVLGEQQGQAILDELVSDDVYNFLKKNDINTVGDLDEIHVPSNRIEEIKSTVAASLMISRRYVRVVSGKVEVFNSESSGWEPCPPNATGHVLMKLQGYGLIKEEDGK